MQRTDPETDDSETDGRAHTTVDVLTVADLGNGCCRYCCQDITLLFG